MPGVAISSRHTIQFMVVTPGMTDEVWDIRNIVAMIENLEALAAKRGPYKKKAA
jgi:hypothetical protein